MNKAKTYAEHKPQYFYKNILGFATTNYQVSYDVYFDDDYDVSYGSNNESNDP
jgi:hypothetical protein